MSASKKYMFVGEHPEVVASGQRLAFGDEINADGLDPKDPVDERLLDDGQFVELAQTKEQKS